MNRVILIGRLTRDPELRYTQTNQPVASFTLAVDRRMSRERKQEAESQNRPTADFIRITVWGQQGENASRYLSKGSQCAVEGRIQTGSYQDQQTGKTVYTTDVVADSVEFIGSRSDNSSNNSGGYGRQNYGDNQDYGNDNYSQTGYQNKNNNNNYNNNSQSGFDSSDDFFDDDFTEIEDDGRIPF